MKVQGKVVIVTGATSGIGLAAARRLLEEGARVSVVGRSAEKTERTADELRRATGGDVVGITCDVSVEPDVERAVDETIRRFGRIDAIVNNAGMMLFKPLAEYSAEDWQRVLGVDLYGAVFFTRQAFLKMSGGGVLVNVSSVHAEMTSPLVAPYAAAKAALVSLTRSAAIEGRDKGIRANALLPGAIDTPMLWDNPNVKSGAEAIDPTDVGKPQDVAAAIAFLVSDDARFVNGEALRVDGGRLARL